MLEESVKVLTMQEEILQFSHFTNEEHGSLVAIWLKKQPEMICLWRSASV